MMNEEELRRLIEEIAGRLIEEKMKNDLGDAAARAINERRRAQGKSDLEL